MTTASDGFGDGGRCARPGEGPDRTPPAACELFDAVAAELALGSLSGAERANALAHLEGCDRCRAAMRELSGVADALLLAAPEADPPVGFEVRLLARLGRGEPARGPARTSGGRAPAAPSSPHVVRRRGRARVALAAAAVVIAGAGVGLGIAVAPQEGNQAAGQFRLASLRTGPGYYSPGSAVGVVAITPGSPAWVVMTFERPGWSGEVRCVVIEHGHASQVGSFWLRNGSGSWAARLSSPASAVTAAEVRGPGGTVFATADFTT